MSSRWCGLLAVAAVMSSIQAQENALESPYAGQIQAGDSRTLARQVVVDRLRSETCVDPRAIEFARQCLAALAHDKSARDSASAILDEVDALTTRRVFLDVRVAISANARLCGLSRAGSTAMTVLDDGQTQGALHFLRSDRESEVVQAPRLITLDRQKATIEVGSASDPDARFQMSVTPRLGHGPSVLLEMQAEVAGKVRIAGRTAVPAGGTALAVRSFERGRRCALLFVQARVVQPGELQAAQPAVPSGR